MTTIKLYKTARQQMNKQIKSELVAHLSQQALDGETLYWESPEESRAINYETAADQCCTDWCVYNELLRTGQYSVAGRLADKANREALAWLIGQALDDYNQPPIGFENLEIAA